MTLDELEAAARASIQKRWQAMLLDPETILDLIARLRAAEAVVEAARWPAISREWAERLDAAIAAYDALGGSK